MESIVINKPDITHTHILSVIKVSKIKPDVQQILKKKHEKKWTLTKYTKPRWIVEGVYCSFCFKLYLGQFQIYWEYTTQNSPPAGPIIIQDVVVPHLKSARLEKTALEFYPFLELTQVAEVFTVEL